MIPEYRIDIKMKDGSLMTIPRGRVVKDPATYGFLLVVSDLNKRTDYLISWDEFKSVSIKSLDEEEQ